MYIFNTLLQRHNESQPKFFLKKKSTDKDIKDKPSVSFSSTSTRSLDPTSNFGFQTLGRGFETDGATQKNSKSISSGLGNFSVPSDYEHIYHAPSQLSDLPSDNQSAQQSAGGGS